jgi:hypothetical protein
MKAVELTKNEREVLEAIVANAKKVGDSGVEFILQDVARETGKNIRSVSATTGSLAKKGMLLTSNGDSYFDGELTEAGLHEVESSNVNNEQEVKQSNNSKNMATKKAKTVKVEDSKSVNNAVDNFDAPVMDERIVALNSYKALKMSAISKSRRPEARELKDLATYILNNWDNLAELKKVQHSANEGTDVSADRKIIIAIIDSRLKNFEDASKACEEAVKETKKAEQAPKAKTEKKETKKSAPAKANKADSKKAEPKAKEEKQPKEKKAETARKVGDVHPNHPTWVWTEYKPGKFDWRTNPADKKQGQRTDKATTSAKKSEPKKDTKKATNKKVAKGGKVETEAPKKDEKKELTIDEFVALPTKSTKTNKKPSEAQKDALKLIMKGYRITSDKKFFENAEGDKKACNWDSITALFKRYGMDYVPEGLVKK